MQNLRNSEKDYAKPRKTNEALRKAKESFRNLEET